MVWLVVVWLFCVFSAQRLDNPIWMLIGCKYEWVVVYDGKEWSVCSCSSEGCAKGEGFGVYKD